MYVSEYVTHVQVLNLLYVTYYCGEEDGKIETKIINYTSVSDIVQEQFIFPPIYPTIHLFTRLVFCSAQSQHFLPILHYLLHLLIPTFYIICFQICFPRFHFCTFLEMLQIFNLRSLFFYPLPKVVCSCLILTSFSFIAKII